MPAQLPGLSTRVRWIIRTQLAAVSPGRKHTPGIHTRATGFTPFTGPARGAVAAAFQEARQDGLRHWGPGHLLLGLTTQDEGTAAHALERLGISRQEVRRQAGQITAEDRQQAGPAPQTRPPGDLIQAVLAEAAAHCDYRIGTDHLLLALFSADDQTAAQALTRLGAGESQLRSAVTALQAESGQEPSA
ncbi:MAG: Clp protease N-terminal domain-containing protein [Trebonia sp.]